MSDLVGNPEDRFSHNEAHIMLFSAMNTITTVGTEVVKQKKDCLYMIIYGSFPLLNTSNVISNKQHPKKSSNEQQD